MAEPFRVIDLTQGFVAVISTEDFRKVNRHSWSIHRSAGSKRKLGQPYARACVNGKKVYLHRFIMGASEGMHVDHKNHCTLDCRRENLEEVTYAENMLRRRKRTKKIERTK